jgi:hypothetical protein
MKGKVFVSVLGVLLSGGIFFAGCAQKSYPADKIKESLLQICRDEYGIENIDVKIAGDTIGVFLPLSKLFAADFKEAAVSGKVRNLETLFEPSPEALEKVEDVLFTISRVILSTDKPFKFYAVEATDVEKTGMQLVLAGYVDDIKRVRVWDISRNEYRKRVVHELRLNRAVLWHKPVRSFLKDLGQLSVQEIQQKYFGPLLSTAAIQKLFNLSPDDNPATRPQWEVLDIRSAPVQKGEVLIYAKTLPYQEGKAASAADEAQYLFLVSLKEEQARIIRIIPFQYRDDLGNIQKISFPKELQIEENLDRWEQEFPLEEMRLGPFLAQQLTRRLQGIMASDERILNTFRDAKLDFEYHEAPKPFFSLSIQSSLKDFNNYTQGSLVFHEDMLYLLTLASREFVDVARSYQFGDFDYLKLDIAQEPNEWFLGREDLELFRRKKIDLQGLLTLPKFS